MTDVTPRIPTAAVFLAALSGGDCDEGRLAEQQHLLDSADTAFALLAVQHPDRCHTAADYPTWTAGGAA